MISIMTYKTRQLRRSFLSSKDVLRNVVNLIQKLYLFSPFHASKIHTHTLKTVVQKMALFSYTSTSFSYHSFLSVALFKMSFFFFFEQDHYCDGSVILCLFFFHIYKSSIAKETSYLSFKLIRLDPGCGVAVLSSRDYYYYCTFCSLGPVHVLLADPRSKKLC